MKMKNGGYFMMKIKMNIVFILNMTVDMQLLLYAILIIVHYVEGNYTKMKQKSPIEELANSLDDECLEALGQFIYDARLSALRIYKKQQKEKQDEE